MLIHGLDQRSEVIHLFFAEQVCFDEEEFGFAEESVCAAQDFPFVALGVDFDDIRNRAVSIGYDGIERDRFNFSSFELVCLGVVFRLPKAAAVSVWANREHFRADLIGYGALDPFAVLPLGAKLVQVARHLALRFDERHAATRKHPLEVAAPLSAISPDIEGPPRIEASASEPQQRRFQVPERKPVTFLHSRQDAGDCSIDNFFHVVDACREMPLSGARCVRGREFPESMPLLCGSNSCSLPVTRLLMKREKTKVMP